MVGGSSKTWKFHHAVTMQIGNPGGILLTVNGKNLGSPGYGRAGDAELRAGHEAAPHQAAG